MELKEPKEVTLTILEEAGMGSVTIIMLIY